MDDFVMDFDLKQAGIQEGKEWLALVRFMQQFPALVEEGLPVIPEEYRNPLRSLVATGSK
jgi:hypothetical protein